jgi:hypothetical protein
MNEKEEFINRKLICIIWLIDLRQPKSNGLIFDLMFPWGYMHSALLKKFGKWYFDSEHHQEGF